MGSVVHDRIAVYTPAGTIAIYSMPVTFRLKITNHVRPIW